MALIKENDLTEGLSGKFGRKIVFRVVKGVTVAARRPTTEGRVLTETQLAHRERFRRAASYAKAKLLDPAAKADYKKMAGNGAFASAFAAAVKDYMTAPEILSINVADYNGAAGSTIPIVVSDNGKIIRVKVSIVRADNTVIESGEASLTNGDVEWKYLTTQALPSLAGNKIIVAAIDRPNNETVFEKVLV